MKLRELQPEEVEFHFEPIHEDEEPETHFDQHIDQEICAFIRELGASGDLPHPQWFCAKVWATWNDFTGVPAFLGCCSYESYEQFQKDDYDRDLKDQALANLQEIVKDYFESLQSLITLDNGMSIEDAEDSLSTANFWGSPVELLFESNELDRIADVFMKTKP